MLETAQSSVVDISVSGLYCISGSLHERVVLYRLLLIVIKLLCCVQNFGFMAFESPDTVQKVLMDRVSIIA